MATLSHTLSDTLPAESATLTSLRSARQSERRNRFRLLADTPRWLLLGALVYAPWAYGCTRPWASAALGVTLGTIVALWLVGCFVRRSRPEVPTLLVIIVLALLTQGWWMALNPKSTFDPEHLVLIPKASLLSSKPGSVDGNLSVGTMLVVSGVLGAMLFVIDLAGRPVWRKRLWLTIACAGFSIALFGILQKIGGESVLGWTWEQEKIDAENNFGMFRYRGNAAAFLNLVAPIIFGLAIEAFRRRQRKDVAPSAAVKASATHAGWAAALIVVIAAIQLNPSRAGWGIALLIGLAIGAALCWRIAKRSEVQGGDLWRWCVIGGVFACLLAGICWIGGWQTSWSRIAAHGIDPSKRSPTEIYLSMVPDAGLLGFGPGTFRAIFPSYQMTYDFGGRAVPEFWTTHNWTHAHNDYLQTLIEWGHLGAALWLLIFLGGIWRAATLLCVSDRRMRSPSPPLERAGERRPIRSRSHRLLIGCSLVALFGVLLHASIDFPLQIPSLQLYVAVLLGLCWSQPTND